METLVMLRNKIQLSKFEDLIGFVKRFMQQAASCQAAMCCSKQVFIVRKRVD